MSTTPDHTVDGVAVSELAASLLSEPVPHLIDGRPVASASGLERPIVNPSTGHEIGRVARGDADDATAAVEAASSSFAEGVWRHLPPRERERRMSGLADLLEEHAEVVGDLDSLDAGILRRYSDGIAAYSANALRYFAGWPTKLEGRLPPVGRSHVVQERVEPVGVVVVIKPWNGPAAFFAQVAPALAAGNSVVLKPSEHTPLSATFLGRLALEAGIPPGVFNIVHGDAEVGEPLVDHPAVARVSFTGSVRTGQAIAKRAAQSLTRVNLELGGKSPVLVFADSDLSVAAAAATSAVWNNSGQVCTAGSRTLVHRSVHDDFVDACIRASEHLQVGSAFDPDADLGPLITPQQLERVRSFVLAGETEGAQLRFQGTTPDGLGGNYQAPVIFSDVSNEMDIAQEEIFGPVMSILPFDDEREAIALANDTRFGLAAGVFTEDVRRVHRLADQLDAGTVWVNSFQNTDAAVSYGGTKESGYGRSLGRASFEEYTRRKSVWIATD